MEARMPKMLDLEILSDLPPEDLEAALAEHTRFSLAPFRGSPRGGSSPLKGSVSDGAVRVGLAQRDWLTVTQPVFRGHIEPLPSGGSRLVGRAGIPGWLVWMMRLAVVVMMPAAVTAATWPLLSQGGAAGPAWAIGFGLVATLATVVGLGLHVAHAEAQLPELEAQLASLAAGPASATVREANAEDERSSTAANAQRSSARDSVG